MNLFRKRMMTIVQKSVMSRGERIVYVLLMLLGFGWTLLFGLWWFQLGHVPRNFSGPLHLLDIATFVLLTYVVWYQIAYELFSWYLSGCMKKPLPAPEPQGGLRVVLLTAFVPGKEPFDVLDRTLQAMLTVDYSHDTWLLDEGNDPTVIALCNHYGVKHYSRHGIPSLNTPEGKYKAKTKAGNYNAWFDAHGDEYDIVGQHDVDFAPRKNFFMRTPGYFRNPRVAFVGTPQIYGNKDESWIAQAAAEQSCEFYGHIQKVSMVIR